MREIEDEIVTVCGNNDTMNDAISEARASISQFLDAFKSPKPNQTHFYIKARFDDENGGAEHIWLADLDFKTKPATGVISNEPAIRTLSYLERVPFLPDQISDWMYYENGRLVGGYTTKLLLRAKSKEGGLRNLLKSLVKM